jgi:hypothetical protein
MGGAAGASVMSEAREQILATIRRGLKRGPLQGALAKYRALRSGEIPGNKESRDR